MKLKILIVTMLGVAGIGASFALANGGKEHGRKDVDDVDDELPAHGRARHGALRRAWSSPSQKSNWKHSPYAPGQVVTVSVGQTGDTVNVIAEGCANGSTLSANAEPSILVATATITTVTGASGPTRRDRRIRRDRCERRQPGEASPPPHGARAVRRVLLVPAVPGRYGSHRLQRRALSESTAGKPTAGT